MHRAALVPGRLGRRPRRLAYVPGGPHHAEAAARTALHSSYAPRRDLAAYVSKGVSTRAYASHAVVRLLVPLEEAAERISPSAGTLEPDGEETCLLRTGAASLDVMVIHVMLMGFEFEVLEPAELVDAIRVSRDRLSRAVARSRRDTESGSGRCHETCGAGVMCGSRGRFMCSVAGVARGSVASARMACVRGG